MKKLFDKMYNTATKLLNKNKDLVEKFDHSLVVSVLACKSEKLYIGMNIAWWHSVCAESTAVSNAYQAGEREFKYLMAVKLKNGTNEFYIIPPCGICREMFSELDMSMLQVILKQDEKYYTKSINELLPEY
ncbi:MAG: hypothetical protein WCX32_00990 [Clostridia bacterium]|jgi:cytidine deaminase|nr:hypothetical protein [Clostridia bacterium]